MIVDKKIYDPVYSAEVWITAGRDLDDWYKKHKITDGNIDDHLSGFVEDIETSDKNGTIKTYHIHIEDKNDFYCLLHESCHLVFHILGDRGVKVDKDNQEEMAYYQTFWFRKLWRIVSQKKKVRSRLKTGI